MRTDLNSIVDGVLPYDILEAYVLDVGDHPFDVILFDLTQVGEAVVNHKLPDVWIGSPAVVVDLIHT